MHIVMADYTRTHGSATQDIDALTQSLEQLLARHKSALKAEGMDRQVENLKRWLLVNRMDLFTARGISETGRAWLSDVHDGLKLAADEMQRLEGEGGIPATKEQAEHNEELLRAIRRIETILQKNSTTPQP